MEFILECGIKGFKSHKLRAAVLFSSSMGPLKKQYIILVVLRQYRCHYKIFKSSETSIQQLNLVDAKSTKELYKGVGQVLT